MTSLYYYNSKDSNGILYDGDSVPAAIKIENNYNFEVIQCFDYATIWNTASN